MIVVLIFVIFYMAASAWDIGHVNGMLGRIATQGPRKQAKPVEPAPRLVINLPSADRPAL
jgi:hypothetical protein